MRRPALHPKSSPFHRVLLRYAARSERLPGSVEFLLARASDVWLPGRRLHQPSSTSARAEHQSESRIGPP